MTCCLFCGLAALPKSHVCRRCHDRVMRDFEIAIIDDALREARTA